MEVWQRWIIRAIDVNQACSARAAAKHLVIRCVRHIVTGESDSSILDLSRQIADWATVVQLAARNKIAPLLFQSLKAHGADKSAPIVSRVLCRHSEQVARRNAALARVLLDTMLLFDRNRVFAVPYRGPVLALLLYRSIGLRQMSDLDFIVPTEAFASAGAALVQGGFRPLSIGPGDCSRTFHGRIGETPVAIDLHRRISRQSLPGFDLSLETMLANTRKVEFLDHEIVTFTPSFTLSILSVVIAKEWIYHRPILAYASDVCRLMRMLSAQDVADAETCSRSLGISRAMEFATCVSGALLGIRTSHMDSKSMLRHASDAERTWTELSYAVGLRGALFLRVSNLNLYDRPVRAALRYLAEMVAFMPYRVLVPGQVDRAWIRVHPSLCFLYPMLRVARLVTTYVLVPFVRRIRRDRI